MQSVSPKVQLMQKPPLSGMLAKATTKQADRACGSGKFSSVTPQGGPTPVFRKEAPEAKTASKLALFFFGFSPTNIGRNHYGRPSRAPLRARFRGAPFFCQPKPPSPPRKTSEWQCGSATRRPTTSPPQAQAGLACLKIRKTTEGGSIVSWPRLAVLKEVEGKGAVTGEAAASKRTVSLSLLPCQARKAVSRVAFHRCIQRQKKVSRFQETNKT